MDKVPSLRFKEFSGEWEEKKLEDIGKIIGGGTPSSTIEEYWNGNIQWFTPTEVGKTKYIDKSVRTITELGLNKSSAKLLPKGTILLSSRATIGEKSIALKEVCTNQGFQSILVNENNDNEFVYYLLDTLKEELIRQSSGSTFLEISGKKLGNISSFFPILEEQEKIANFLSSVDKKISIVEEKLNLFNQYKKGIMQKIFSQKLRFKNENGNNYPEWEERKLGEISKIYDGTHQTPNYVEKGIPFFSVENITNNNFFNTKYVTEEAYIENNKKRKIEKNDILMTRIGSIGESKLIDWDIKADFYVSLALIKLDKNSYPSYINQFINSKFFQKELDRRTLKVAFPQKINLSDIGECLIKLPYLEEQKKIADFLSAIDNKIENISDNLENLKLFKKSMLQKMFV